MGRKKKKKGIHKSRFNVFDNEPLPEDKPVVGKEDNKEPDNNDKNSEDQPAKPAHSGILTGGSAESGYRYTLINEKEKNRNFSWNPDMSFYSTFRHNIFSDTSSKSFITQKDITKKIDDIIKQLNNKIKNYGKCRAKEKYV